MTMLTRMNNPKIFEEPYFLWLCSQLKIGGRRRSKVEFAWTLYQKPFICFVPNDDNRCVDGIKLREIFSEEKFDGDVVDMQKPCSILELIIGVAIRMDHILSNPKVGNRTNVWFWELINNLELIQFYDNDPDMQAKIKHNDQILERFINRRYNRSGYGGLFPLKRPEADQRKVEIWYQMMAYLDENHID